MNTKQNQSATEEALKREESAETKGEEQPVDQHDLPVSVDDMNSEEIIQMAEKERAKKPEAHPEHEKEKFLRLVAEFENYKKRTLREKTDLIKTAGQEVISSLLPVLDDFERAIKNVADVDDTVKEGLLLIYQKLKTILEQKGLKAMETIGQPFDTDLHEAITSIPAPDAMKGKVVDEAEKGYFMNGKVLRHARVIVGE